ncbi:MAG: polysaccharide deacetylase family protein [Promethearchaeota archaeon]
MTDIIVCLTFDYDAESVQIRALEEAVRVSKGQFAVKRGISRILALLEKHEIQGTFFTCGWTADIYPETVSEIVSQNHEIAAHGYLHENFDTLSVYEQNDAIQKTHKALEEIGSPGSVKGFRAPYWRLAHNTLQLVAEMGYIYDSSLMADDRPYFLQFPEIAKKLVEFPVEWFLDDWPLFEMQQKPPSVVFEIWKAQFDALLEMDDIPEGYRVFNLTLHPACSGHAYRIRLLERLIEYMKDAGAKFSRMDDVAESILAKER